MAAVTNGVPEWFCEFCRDEHGKVGVLGLGFIALVRVTVDCKDLMMALVFRSDFSVGAHAARTHFVVKGRCVEKCLDLVELSVKSPQPSKGISTLTPMSTGTSLSPDKILDGFFHPRGAFASGCRRILSACTSSPLQADACDGSVGIQEDFFDHLFLSLFTAVFYGLIRSHPGSAWTCLFPLAYRCRNKCPGRIGALW